MFLLRMGLSNFNVCRKRLDLVKPQVGLKRRSCISSQFRGETRVAGLGSCSALSRTIRAELPRGTCAAVRMPPGGSQPGGQSSPHSRHPDTAAKVSTQERAKEDERRNPRCLQAEQQKRASVGLWCYQLEGEKQRWGWTVSNEELPK